MSYFKYDELVQNALVAVVREVLDDVSKNGLSDNHHFYIRFRTDHPNVKIPRYLKEQHPEEVMIVIQYQFWDLKVAKDYFTVDLSFNTIRETLKVPFAALSAFVDPSVKFALQFTPSFGDNDGKSNSQSEGNSSSQIPGDGKIISFDSFRKK